MKSSQAEFYRLEDRVLFEAGAVAQAAEAAAAENINAENVVAEAQEASAEAENSSVVTDADLAKVALPPQTGDDTAADPDGIFGFEGTVEVPAEVQGDKVLVVINSSVADAGKIVNDLGENYEILYLQRGTDAMDAINDYLDAHADTEYSALHIVSHGKDGFFILNGETVGNDSLNPADWKAVGEHLADDAEIMIYGCDTAKSDEGKALIQQIANLTGAEVAASTDATGANGDWDLEYQTGLIESALLAPEEYTHTLATEQIITVTTLADDAGDSIYSFREAVEAANAAGSDVTTKIEFNLADTDTVTLTEEVAVEANITIDGTNAATGNNITIKAEVSFYDMLKQYKTDQGGAIEDITVDDITALTKTANRTFDYNGVSTTEAVPVLWEDYVSKITQTRLFNIAAQNVTLSISNATIEGGRLKLFKYAGEDTTVGTAFKDGAVFKFSNSKSGLKLDHVSVLGGYAENRALISANQSNSVVEITNSTLSYGYATSCSGAGEVNGTLVIENSEISHNKAADQTGGFKAKGSTLTINNALFDGNQAGSKNGGALEINVNSAFINGVTFVNNRDGSNGANIGGAVFVQGGKQVDIVNSTFFNNATASTVQGVITLGSSQGGTNAENTVLNLINSSIIQNSGSGSGLYVFEGTANVINSVIAGNKVDISVAVEGTVNAVHTAYGTAQNLASNMNLLAGSDTNKAGVALDEILAGSGSPMTVEKNGVLHTIFGLNKEHAAVRNYVRVGEDTTGEWLISYSDASVSAADAEWKSLVSIGSITDVTLEDLALAEDGKNIVYVDDAGVAWYFSSPKKTPNKAELAGLTVAISAVNPDFIEFSENGTVKYIMVKAENPILETYVIANVDDLPKGTPVIYHKDGMFYEGKTMTGNWQCNWVDADGKSKSDYSVTYVFYGPFVSVGDNILITSSTRTAGIGVTYDAGAFTDDDPATNAVWHYGSIISSDLTQGAFKAYTPAAKAGAVVTEVTADQIGIARKSGVVGAVTPEAASLIVTTANDAVNIYDGETSLREALAYAATLGDGSTVSFAEDVKWDADGDGKFTIVLDAALGELAITSSVNIVNNTDCAITVKVPVTYAEYEAAVTEDAATTVVASDFRVLNISGAVTVDIDGGKGGFGFEGGKVVDMNGGIIHISGTDKDNQANVSMHHVTIQNGALENTNTTKDYGGAIYASHANLTIDKNSEIKNIKFISSNIDGYGVALAMVNSGKLTVTDAVISNNISQKTNSTSMNCVQGVIYFGKTTEAEFTKVTLFSNTSRWSVISAENANLTMDECIVADSKGQDWGALQISGGKTVLKNTTFKNSMSNGGGLRFYGGANVELGNCSFTNSSTSLCPGILVDGDKTVLVAKNISIYDHKAYKTDSYNNQNSIVTISGGTATFINSTFTCNSTDASTSFSARSNARSILCVSKGTLNLLNSTVVNYQNETMNGICVTKTGTLNLVNSIVVGNGTKAGTDTGTENEAIYKSYDIFRVTNLTEAKTADTPIDTAKDISPVINAVNTVYGSYGEGPQLSGYPSTSGTLGGNNIQVSGYTPGANGGTWEGDAAALFAGITTTKVNNKDVTGPTVSDYTVNDNVTLKYLELASSGKASSAGTLTGLGADGKTVYYVKDGKWFSLLDSVVTDTGDTYSADAANYGLTAAGATVFDKDITGATRINSMFSAGSYAVIPSIQVSFDMNTGSLTGTGSMDDLSVKYGTPVSFTSDYALDTWTLLGFSTDQNATTAEYTAVDSTYTLTDTQIGELFENGTDTLYAIWMKDYTVTYHEAGKDARTETFHVYNGNSEFALTADQMKMADLADWNELGWSTADNSSTTVDVSKLTITGDTVFYAVYTRTVSVEYNGGGAAGSMPNTEALQYRIKDTVNPTNLTIAENEFTRSGLVFAGWSLTPDGSAISDTSITVSGTDAALRTLYALWKEAPSLVVTTADDVVANDGLTSFREAMNYAMTLTDGGTVTFSKDVFNSTNGFTVNIGSDTQNTGFNITKNITIDGDVDGDGTADIVIDGTGMGVNISKNKPLFIVSSEIEFTLQNLTIQKFTTTSWSRSGVLYVTKGSVDILNCTFSNNEAAYGSAIYQENGNITISGSSFANNANVKSGNEEMGGAIYISNGTMAITDSTFTGNNGKNGKGGAIAQKAGTLTVSDSKFENNIIEMNWSGYGGGAYYQMGGIATFTANEFTANNGMGYGGAIHQYGDSSSLTLTGDNVFTGNLTSNGGAIYMDGKGTVNIDVATFSGHSVSNGGAIYQNNGTLNITNAMFSGNTASSAAGAIYQKSGSLNVTDSMFSGNAVTGSQKSGGAIYQAGGSAVFDGVTFAGNQTNATQGNGFAVSVMGGTTTILNSLAYGNSGGWGGTFYSGNASSILNVINCTVVNNISKNTTADAQQDAGGIKTENGKVYLLNSVVAGNISRGVVADITGSVTMGYTTYGTANFNYTWDNSNPKGLTVLVDGSNRVLTDVSSAEASLKEVLGADVDMINHDYALGLDGAALTGGTLVGNVDGRIVFYNQSTGKWSDLAGTAVADFSETAENFGLTGTSVKVYDTGINGISRTDTLLVFNQGAYTLQADGAGMVVTTAEDVNNPFDGVLSLREAISVAQRKGGTVTFSKDVFNAANGMTVNVGNENFKDGFSIAKDLTISGHVDLDNDGVVDEGEIITINADGLRTLNDSGTPVYAKDIRLFDVRKASLTLNDLTITNTAGGVGGAVQAATGSTLTTDNLTLTDNITFWNNDSGGKGAIFIRNSTAVIKKSTFSGNTSSGPISGGVFYIEGSSDVTITDSVFTGNKATWGGAICQNAGTLKITGSTFSSNKVTNDWGEPSFGGAIYQKAGTLTITDSGFTGNTAANVGGAIAMNGSGSVTVSGTSSFSENTAYDGGAI